MLTGEAAATVLTALLESRTGQQLGAGRTWRIDAALAPLLRDRNLASIDQLVGEMLSGRAPDLPDAIVDVLLNQETSFFRDPGVIEGAPALVADCYGERPRIWSAGCSTGQEPLSLAMVFSERAGPQPEIVATDVSRNAITRAARGLYTQFEIQRGLPMRRMITWFDGDDSEWHAKPELLSRVTFRQHNLVSDRPPAGKFDLILCRNVLMYFSQAVRRQVFDRFAEALAPGGLLVLGAGETVIGQTDRFEPSRAHRGMYELAQAQQIAQRA